MLKNTHTDKWIVGQSMDNRIVLFQILDDKLRFARKKAFRGRNTAGYACSTDYSPDMRYFYYDGKNFVPKIGKKNPLEN